VSPTINVQVWSDIACPWCFIGKRRLEEGIRRFTAEHDADGEVTYRSFELSPDTPVDYAGTTTDYLAQRKAMAVDQVQAMLAQVTAIAAEEGLAYDFDAVRHTSTRKAHELLHLAKERGLQLATLETLFAAYFEQGRHLGHQDVLVELAERAGVDAREAREALADGRYAEAVRADVAEAARLGIQGVPFYVVDGRYGVSGAQRAEVFAQALTQAAQDRAGVA